MLIDILTIGVLSISALIFGYGFSASAVAHPAMLDAKIETAVDFFKPFFRRSNHTQLALSMLVWALAGGLSYLTGDWRWFITATVLQVSGPYTIFFIMPTNRRIMADGADPHSAQMTADLTKWGSLHFPRTLIAGGVFVFFAYLAVIG